MAAESEVLPWGRGYGWVPSATVARCMGTVAVLAAEVGLWLRLWRLQGHSGGGGEVGAGCCRGLP